MPVSVQEPDCKGCLYLYSPTGWGEKHTAATILTLFGYPGKGGVSSLMDLAGFTGSEVN